MALNSTVGNAESDADFVLIGSGFAACVLALVLQRMGKRCVILEAQQHPRFAIGESSTPLADQILLEFGREFSLPELSRLGRWSTARHLPGVVVGCKRGFSYFFHHEGSDNNRPLPRLLVPASPDLESADSHWHRGSVDHFLARAASARGIQLHERTRVVSLERRGGRWHLTALTAAAAAGQTPKNRGFQADFLIDASGPARVVPTLLAPAAGPAALDPAPVERWDDSTAAGPWTFATDSGAIFGHFALPVDWERCWRDWGLASQDFSFPPQQAALHHVTATGWMWHLGFDNDVVSLGWVLPAAELAELGPQPTAEQKVAWWQQQLRRYPRLAALYAGGRLLDPPGGLGFLPRLQRFQPPSAGPGWLALPNTVGFIDPLHSTGIAHSLFSVQEIVGQLSRFGVLEPEFLRAYAARLRQEFWLIDQLVALAYLSTGDPQKWEAATMVYFAAAIAAEEQARRPDTPRAHPAACSASADRVSPAGPGFLWAQQTDWLERVARARHLLTRTKPPAVGWLVAMSEILGPLNTVGLCDPALNGVYHYTAAVKR
jgi:FADH2 O2-dependent halogenase